MNQENTDLAALLHRFGLRPGGLSLGLRLGGLSLRARLLLEEEILY